jgi:hypothetical protein
MILLHNLLGYNLLRIGVNLLKATASLVSLATLV